MVGTFVYMQNSLLELGKAIRDSRKAKNLTLRDVANLAGVHFTTLSALERGAVSELGIRKVQRVAETLGLELVLRPKGRRYTLDDIARERANPAKNEAPKHRNRRGLIGRAMEQRLEESDSGSKSVGNEGLIARALKKRP